MARRGGRRNKGRGVIPYAPAREVLTEPAPEDAVNPGSKIVLDSKESDGVLRELLTEPAPGDRLEEERIAAMVNEGSPVKLKAKRKKKYPNSNEGKYDVR